MANRQRHDSADITVGDFAVERVAPRRWQVTHLLSGLEAVRPTTDRQAALVLARILARWKLRREITSDGTMPVLVKSAGNAIVARWAVRHGLRKNKAGVWAKRAIPVKR